MSWETTVSDLAGAWKAGLAFLVLVAARYLLASRRLALRPARAEQVRSAREFIDSAVIALVMVFLFIRPFAAQAYYIPSESMKPTLEINDRIFVDKLSYRLHPPHRGDVVVFRTPPYVKSDQEDFVKRLIALPGDTVAVHDGHVYVNGRALEEPYIAAPPALDMPLVKVRPGRVFVMGDNRNNSYDSRYCGRRPEEQLDMGRIRGKARIIFWPPGRAGLIR